MKDHSKAVIYALAACVIWGSVYVAIKVGLNHGMRPLTFAGIRFLAGAVIGFGGVLIASYRPGMMTGGYRLGIAVLVLSAIAWACSSIAAKKIMETRDTLTVTGMQMVLGALPLLAAGRIFEGRIMAGADSKAIAVLAYLVIFATSIPFLAWYKALRLGEVGRVSVFGFTLPILGVISGWLVLGEPMSLGMLLGMAMVAFGIIIVNIR